MTRASNRSRLFQLTVGTLLCYSIIFCSSSDDVHCRDMKVSFKGEAVIEVGGPFVGVEFHKSQMIPQRISFYYPVANSIDYNQDFWHRDTSFVMKWGLTIGNSAEIEIGKDPAEIELAPYTVKFQTSEQDFTTAVHYHFCHEKPAMVLRISITNTLDRRENFRFATNLKTSLKTSHSYKLIEAAIANYDEETGTSFTWFPDEDTDSAMIFIANAGTMPVANKIDLRNTGFVYEKQLNSGDKLEIIQIIGSAKKNESADMVNYLLGNHEKEVKSYENSIKQKALKSSYFISGSKETDHSVAWAKAVMEVNIHYLDEEFVPMPCPAEYNFQFTHDQLVTDLAAVNFDLQRVRYDLDYIVRHADENFVIPHAYYWKDGAYQTEFATADNWNNFWFVIVSAAYLRHSNDIKLLRDIYPYLRVSIENAIKNLEPDHLMWSSRPDWWDIGDNYGPKSYMSVLAVKALRDFVFISARLGIDNQQLIERSRIADKIEEAIAEKLWSDEHNYLMNYFNSGEMDPHYYTGSLLAAHYCDFDSTKMKLMLRTAKEKMVDENVGIYNVYPMDFADYKEIIGYIDNEVGDEYYYFNGGIWPQGNAWYALAQIEDGQSEAAGRFIKKTMSLHGIMQGPNGQPAYYEVRNGNRKNSTEYGKVDKPQFLWAGAWYIYSLYHLHGITENTWNLELSPYLTPDQKESRFSYVVDGNSVDYHITGESGVKTISSICFDGKRQYSRMIPQQNAPQKSIEIETGEIKYPYLHSTKAIVNNVNMIDNLLVMDLSAFTGHQNCVIVIAPKVPKSVKLNGENILSWKTVRNSGYEKIVIDYLHEFDNAQLKVKF